MKVFGNILFGEAQRKDLGMKTFLIIWLISFVLLNCQALGADTLVLKESAIENFRISNNYFELFEDTSQALSPKRVMEEGKGITFHSPKHNFNINRNSVYWVKITMKNSSDPFTHYLLENYYNHTTDFRLYFKEGNYIYMQQSGEATVYKYRDYQHKNLIFDLPIGQNTARTFYFRVHSRLYTDFNFQVKTFHYFTYYTINEYMLLGIYYGILIIMALYNLILFFTIRARIYLFYIFYVCAGIIVSLNEDKLGYQYLWPDNPSLNPILAYYVAPMLLTFTFLIYATEFLELQIRAKKLFYFAWSFFALHGIIFVTNFFFSTPILLRILYIFPYLIILIASIVLFAKGYKSARFLVIGASLILVSVILIQLRAESILPGTLFTVYILNYSLIVETVILSIALSDRIKIIQREVIKELKENKKLQEFANLQMKEKQVLQEKVNKELEGKVNERTVQLKIKKEELEKNKEELEIANSKLQSLIDQANSMNVKLDIDNWELKKNVRQELLQRITGNEVTFEVFKTVFKDDLTCLRFLDAIKWPNEFNCKKCGYEGYKEVQASLIRKCSRCGYSESVTSGTLLHGVKFSISSALYLIYLVYRRSGNIKLEVISEIAGISSVSASKFKNKVVNKMELLTKKKKHITWEEIVF